MKPKKEHYRQKLPHFQQPGQWYSVTVSLFGAMPKGAMAKYSLKLINAKNRYQLLLNQERSPSQDMDFPKSMVLPNEQNNFDLGKSKSHWNRDMDLPKSMVLHPNQNETKSFELGNSKSRKEEAKKAYIEAIRNYRLAYDKFLHKSTEPTISLIEPANREVIEDAMYFWEGKKLKTHAWCIMSNHFHWVITVFEKDEHGDPIFLQDILHSVKQFTAKKINKAENRKGQLWEHESFETTIRNNEHYANVFNYVINNPVSAGLVKSWIEWHGTWTEDMDFRRLTPLQSDTEH